MLNFDLRRLDRSLRKASLPFDAKKALVLVVGTLLIAFFVQGASPKYSGTDVTVRNFLASSHLQSKLAVSCKLISEDRGLLHEFDTLGDFEDSGVGSYSYRSTQEKLAGEDFMQITLQESRDNMSSFGIGMTEFQIVVKSRSKDSSLKNHAEGKIGINGEGEGSLVIELNSKTFVKCLSLKVSEVTPTTNAAGPQ